MPCAVDAISTVSKPANTAEAGLVPCAESGISTFVRRSPRAASALRIISMPASSPCAPAAAVLSALREATPVFVNEASNQWMLTRFDDVHRLVLRWVEQGLVDGLRIDHLDGLLFLDRVAGAHAVFARKTYL